MGLLISLSWRVLSPLILFIYFCSPLFYRHPKYSDTWQCPSKDPLKKNEFIKHVKSSFKSNVYKLSIIEKCWCTHQLFSWNLNLSKQNQMVKLPGHSVPEIIDQFFVSGCTDWVTWPGVFQVQSNNPVAIELVRYYVVRKNPFLTCLPRAVRVDHDIVALMKIYEKSSIQIIYSHNSGHQKFWLEVGHNHHHHHQASLSLCIKLTYLSFIFKMYTDYTLSMLSYGWTFAPY